MVSTYVREEAAQRLRNGLPWVYRDEIVSVEGMPHPGEPVLLCDERGAALGIGDVDLESKLAIRRIGMPGETAEGIIQRHLRRALDRRAHLVPDPRYCRLVNDDGDGLPGLTVDRYGAHFVVQTASRAMDARLEEISRSLAQVMDARSVLVRNDGRRRSEAGLPPSRPHVLLGAPPRWTRVLELGARFTVDLFGGPGTGYTYELRQVRRSIARMAPGARVLDPCCGVGGLFVHAGLHGARAVVAFEPDPDCADLAHENAEANGLLGRASVDRADAFAALESLQEPFDLVLLDAPPLDASEDLDRDAFVRLVRLSVRATRHGGRMIVCGRHPPLPQGSLDVRLARACEQEGRLATRLFRPGLPVDFPALLGTGGEDLSAVAFEVS